VPVPVSRKKTIERRAVAAFTQHLPIKLAAAFFAFVLWMIVTAEEPVDAWVDVRTTFLLDSGVTVANRLPRVQARVQLRRRELFKLYTTPPELRHAVTTDSDSVVVVDLRTADVDLEGIDARISDLRPRAVRLHLLGTARRTGRETIQSSSSGAVRTTHAARAPVHVDSAALRDSARARADSVRDSAALIAPDSTPAAPAESVADSLRPRDTVRAFRHPAPPRPRPPA
jgi:hypothetical protein